MESPNLVVTTFKIDGRLMARLYLCDTRPGKVNVFTSSMSTDLAHRLSLEIAKEKSIDPNRIIWKNDWRK
jgi:hypothetical protein